MLRELEQTILDVLNGVNSGAKFQAPLSCYAESILAQGLTTPKQMAWVHPQLSMQSPDEWVAGDITYPALNVWRMLDVVDPSRHRTGVHRRPHLRDDGSSTDPNFMDVKRHQVPVTLTYEFAMRARYQEQITQLRESFHKRFPRFGYGGYLLVTTDDGVIEVPFKQVGYADVSEQEKEGERELEVHMTYEMLAWADEATWEVERTVRMIVVRSQADTAPPDSMSISG